LAALRFAGVRKDFGEVTAIRDLDLEAADGELLVLVGPSGSGKSTALRLAAGLEDVTEGAIYIGGRDVTRLRPGCRNVAMVFQSYALFPHLSVAENIGFGLRARKVARAAAQKKIQDAARLVGCEGVLERKPFQLSGGERQRVALARALVREPHVFLLDEPLSNLDAQLRVQMRAELQQLHRRVGATMVYVTHDQVEALTLGDRVAVLRDGAVQQVGSPDEIYEQPANSFVGHFIGSPAMNLLPGRIEEGTLRAGPFTFDPPSLNGAVSGRQVEAGIRPEHLHVATGGEGVPAEVQIVEVAGNETFLHLTAEGSTLVARLGTRLRPAIGSTVLISADADHLYLFDAATGAALE
jgi:multiple sugar transport system ATP-binding protein